MRRFALVSTEEDSSQLVTIIVTAEAVSGGQERRTAARPKDRRKGDLAGLSRSPLAGQIGLAETHLIVFPS
jgi:hypothetical protein